MYGAPRAGAPPGPPGAGQVILWLKRSSRYLPRWSCARESGLPPLLKYVPVVRECPATRKCRLSKECHRLLAVHGGNGKRQGLVINHRPRRATKLPRLHAGGRSGISESLYGAFGSWTLAVAA